MDYRLIVNSNYSSLREIEDFLLYEVENIDLSTIHWTFIEETAVAFVKADYRGLIYISLLKGAKQSFFSNKSINQVFIIASDHQKQSFFQIFYYRLLRKLNSPLNRVKTLGASNQQELKAEIEDLLKPSSYEGERKEAYQFYFYIEQKADRELFINLCRENEVRNLKFTNVYPIYFKDQNVLGSLMDEEYFLFIGELPYANWNCFIGGYIESGFNIEKIDFIEIKKLK